MYGGLFVCEHIFLGVIRMNLPVVVRPLLSIAHMITCEACKKTFMADYQQGWPGHCDPPSSLISYAVSFAAIAIVCGIVGVYVFRTAMLVLACAFSAGTLLSLFNIPEARRVCEQSGGGVCPSCGHKNQVKWNS
jgi:hypothetical protein